MLRQDFIVFFVWMIKMLHVDDDVAVFVVIVLAFCCLLLSFCRSYRRPLRSALDPVVCS